MTDPPSAFARALADIAHEAGRLILQHFERGSPVRRKSDNSLVTAADEQAEDLILARLATLAPEIPVIAEEQMARSAAKLAGPKFFLVDPLDGTEEFVSRREEFTVNIALIQDGLAVCGVLLAPAKHRVFVGENGKGAFELTAPASGDLDFSMARPIHVRRQPGEGITVLVSRTHGAGENRLYGERAVARVSPVASSLKFGLLAAGEADLYPRIGRTMEWDTAAGQAVLEAAGGSMQTTDGRAFFYGKEATGFQNPGFVARGQF